MGDGGNAHLHADHAAHSLRVTHYEADRTALMAHGTPMAPHSRVRKRQL